ncbi:MAG: hypothetical protein M3O22_06260 [Pseudomonadota bacterium]|nr:hypothetical protein [Pseudomonadota bacterium]
MNARNAVFLVLALGLAACGWKETGEKIEPRRNTAENQILTAKQPATEVRHDPLTVTNQVWYGAQAVRLRQGLPLPPAVEGPRAVALVSASPLPLKVIASQISMQTGIPVRLEDGADQPITPTAAPTVAGALPAVIGGPGEPLEQPGLPVAYEGPLTGLLDQVASGFGTTWEFDGTAIVLRRYETRTFVVEALPSKQTIEDGLRADSQDSGSGGGTGTDEQAEADITQTATLAMELKFWDEFSEALKTLLGNTGTYSISPSSGSVTVIATPGSMSRIAKFVEDENSRLARQVALNVQVYNVSLRDMDEFGLDLDIVFKASSAAPTFGFGGTPTGLTSTALGELGATIVAPVTGTAAKFTGSSAVVQALSQVGDVAQLAQIPMTVLNNSVGSRQFVVNQAYLREINVSTDEGVTTTEVTPGNIQTGITFQAVPRILPDGRIMVQYSLALRELIELTDFQFGEDENQRIQLPETQARVYVQQAMMKSGSTLVLAGFENDQTRRSRQGFGHESNWLLGGGQETSDERDVMVIAITATEIDVKRGKEG